MHYYTFWGIMSVITYIFIPIGIIPPGTSGSTHTPGGHLVASELGGLLTTEGGNVWDSYSQLPGRALLRGVPPFFSK